MEKESDENTVRINSTNNNIVLLKNDHHHWLRNYINYHKEHDELNKLCMTIDDESHKMKS